MHGILFKNHTMNFPNDERTLGVAIYRDDMIKSLHHGDQIQTYTSAGNVWKYDEGIRLNEISWWNGKKVFDYHYFLEVPTLSDIEINPDGSFLRSNLLFGKHKFLQLVLPADYFKNRFNSSVNNRSKVFSVYHLLSNCDYTVKEVLSIKRLTDGVLKHGKDGDGNVFEPHVGHNAYVDLVLSIPDKSKLINGKDVDVKTRVFIRSLFGLDSDDSILNYTKTQLDFYVKQVVGYLAHWYGDSFYII